jgi:hypothetical protein
MAHIDAFFTLALLVLLLSFDTTLALIVTKTGRSSGRHLTRPKRFATNLWMTDGTDAYPWRFSGRLWFRPAFVRLSNDVKPLLPRKETGINVLCLLGWTIGGVVALEYDDSPVGPYREYVTMGALLSKRGTIGQWGSRLYVSTKEAEKVCREIWSVPAELADIRFTEDGAVSLRVLIPPESESNDKQVIEVGGWSATRISRENAPLRGGIPVLWTPSIKTLWAPFVPLQQGSTSEGLPLHRLRLSASVLRIHFCGQEPSKWLGVPIGIGLLADNVLIEISPQIGEL